MKECEMGLARAARLQTCLARIRILTIYILKAFPLKLVLIGLMPGRRTLLTLTMAVARMMNRLDGLLWLSYMVSSEQIVLDPDNFCQSSDEVDFLSVAQVWQRHDGFQCNILDAPKTDIEKDVFHEHRYLTSLIRMHPPYNNSLVSRVSNPRFRNSPY